MATLMQSSKVLYTVLFKSNTLQNVERRRGDLRVLNVELSNFELQKGIECRALGIFDVEVRGR